MSYATHFHPTRRNSRPCGRPSTSIRAQDLSSVWLRRLSLTQPCAWGVIPSLCHVTCLYSRSRPLGPIDRFGCEGYLSPSNPRRELLVRYATMHIVHVHVNLNFESSVALHERYLTRSIFASPCRSVLDPIAMMGVISRFIQQRQCEAFFCGRLHNILNSLRPIVDAIGIFHSKNILQTPTASCCR